MLIAASKLRKNIYRILDEAIETGVPAEILWNGTVVRIVPEWTGPKLARLKKRAGFTGDPDDIICMDWLQRSTDS